MTVETLIKFYNREPLEVPETLQLKDMLARFQKNRTHMAAVASSL